MATAAPSLPPATTDPSPAQVTAESPDPFASIDPTLHGATLDSVTRTEGGSGDLGEDANRLSDFARHVLTDDPGREGEGLNHGSMLGFEGDSGDIYTQPPAQEFTELLDATRREQEHNGTSNSAQGQAGDAGNGQSGMEDPNELTQSQRDQLNGLEMDTLEGEDLDMEYQPETHGRVIEQPGGGPPPPPPERSRRGKRKRDDGEVVPLNANGEEVDATRLKKDNHKEVERRRRENINDGLMEIAKHVPGGFEKMGKGTFLRKAAERLAEVTIKADLWDAEQANKGQGDAQLRDQIHRLQAQLEEEQVRSMRYETSWREAEDRAAASQFDLARTQTELDELKRHLEAQPPQQ